MMKAVKITEANRNMLAARFDVVVDDIPDVLPVGYYLVTDFGIDEHFETLTQAVMDLNFAPTGVTMDNGFFELMRI